MNQALTPYQQRFAGIARLYGVQALERLAKAHFMVIGVGGVGSWTAEALARTGIGELTIIDLDDVCITNTNRQLHALTSTVGKSKVLVMQARLLDINPALKIHAIEDFVDTKNILQLIQPNHHVVIDAIDSVKVKSALIAYCRARKIRLLTVGSAGGKTDVTQIVCEDLGKTVSDPMLAKVRYTLYKQYHFARDKTGVRKFRVDAIYCKQQAVFPHPDGEVCQQKTADMAGVKLDCAQGFGSSMMMTASMGLCAAEKAVQRYLQSFSALKES